MITKCLISKGALLVISLIVLYYIVNYIVNNYNTTEEFTPKMREMYRPYLRHARIVSEGFYGDNKNNINHLFRKFGLY